MGRSLTLSLLLFLIVGSSAGCRAPAAKRLEVGRPASEAEIAARDVSVFPDGAGLPRGHGTAREGKLVFAAQCAACHGATGEGRDDYPALVGGRGTLTTSAPVLTVGSYWPHATTVWDYIHRAMPYVAPGTLRPDDVYALTAFLLHANGIVREDEVLDERTLPLVAMPNRGGFVPDPRPDVGAAR
jgi:mono/diheme cytochrome c family protein